MSKPKKSWKTTIAGWAAVLAAVANAAVALLDGNPETTFDVQTIIASLAAVGIGFGLIKARDNDVSSEDVGAK